MVERIKRFCNTHKTAFTGLHHTTLATKLQLRLTSQTSLYPMKMHTPQSSRRKRILLRSCTVGSRREFCTAKLFLDSFKSGGENRRLFEFAGVIETFVSSAAGKILRARAPIGRNIKQKLLRAKKKLGLASCTAQSLSLQTSCRSRSTKLSALLTTRQDTAEDLYIHLPHITDPGRCGHTMPTPICFPRLLISSVGRITSSVGRRCGHTEWLRLPCVFGGGGEGEGACGL